MSIAIADLRTRATLEQPVDTVDSAGALLRTWTPVADVWAKVTPRNGAESFAAGAQESAIAYDATIRWRADASSPMRLRIGARALYIRAAFDPDGRKRFLVCRCEEIVA